MTDNLPDYMAGIEYTLVDVPVIDGIATLPDGRTVRTESKVVRVVHLTPEMRARMIAQLPVDDEDIDLD